MDGCWTTQVIDPVYVVARAALPDALDALGEQRDAVVLVGAQAIYLHTGEPTSLFRHSPLTATWPLNRHA